MAAPSCDLLQDCPTARNARGETTRTQAIDLGSITAKAQGVFAIRTDVTAIREPRAALEAAGTEMMASGFKTAPVRLKPDTTDGFETDGLPLKTTDGGSGHMTSWCPAA